MVSMSSLHKTNRLLQVFIGAFLLIAFRIWHLAIIQREEKLVESQRPQRRTFVQKADRGSIVDRFGIPLAQSRINYNASIYYNQIAQIAPLGWKVDAEGKRWRTYPRKEYIRRLSQMLGRSLSLDSVRIADLIHSKASLFPHVPFVIESNISEEQYYRMRALERDWPGLHAESSSERFYPMGQTASHLLGHLGAINHREHLEVVEELDLLQQMILDGNEESSITARYQGLKERAYTINDLVGKTGLEKQYEQELRGYSGKKTFEIDQKGQILRQVAGGREPVSGQKVILSLSVELQQFCESLLIENEKTRDKRSLGIDPESKKRRALKQPWIKGGAIVALDPNTGEVLAMASTPRFDPNDFILTSDREKKSAKIRRWQESESQIAAIFDGREPLYREKGSKEEFAYLTWESYLEWILPQEGPLHALWNRADDLKTAITLQEDFEALLYFAGNPKPPLLMDALFPSDKPAGLEKDFSKIQTALKSASEEATPHKRRIEALLSGIPHNSDKLFALDLCRMAVYSPAFTDELITKTGSLKIPAYRHLVQSLKGAEDLLRKTAKERFHTEEFRDWRRSCFKEFLLQKRVEEKERNTYARPYLDYLDQREKEMFEELWDTIRIPLLVSYVKQDASLLQESSLSYFDVSLLGSNFWTKLRTSAADLTLDECAQWMKTMRSYRQLERSLWGSYATLRGKRGEQTEKNLAAAFYPIGGFALMRSHALQCAAPLGSIFKLVTGYEALRQNERQTEEFTIFDEVRFNSSRRTLTVAATLDRKPIPRHYKGGRLPRSHLPQMGNLDLLGALEQSSNPFFGLLGGDLLSDPQDLVRAAADFGFGERSGIDLPGEIKGRLPNDVRTNRTGLYSFAIGQHTLVVTPLQTACMLSTLANGGKLLTPRLARCLEGLHPERGIRTAAPVFRETELALLGIDFPLFCGQDAQADEKKRAPIDVHLRRPLSLTASARNLLFEGMDRVVWGAKGCARPRAIKEFYGKPGLLREFLSLKHQLIGKTSTAEVLGRESYNPGSAPIMFKHIWFGAIAFEPPSKERKDPWERPEIVVAVYLRYGDGGKEAAPLAAQTIQKWREIKRASAK
jgi:cell division protein FtsI/penicillin-binding protein 2